MLGQMLKSWNFSLSVFFSSILTLLIILIKPLTTKAHDRRASGDCGTSGSFWFYMQNVCNRHTHCILYLRNYHPRENCENKTLANKRWFTLTPWEIKNSCCVLQWFFHSLNHSYNLFLVHIRVWKPSHSIISTIQW